MPSASENSGPIRASDLRRRGLIYIPKSEAASIAGKVPNPKKIIKSVLPPGSAAFEFTLPTHEPLKLAGEITHKETLRLHAEMLHVDRIARQSEVKSAPKILGTARPEIPGAVYSMEGP